MLKSLVFRFSQFICLWAAGALIAAWTAAPLTAFADQLVGRPLSYEVTVRVYILWTLVLLCGAYAVYGMVRAREFLSRRTLGVVMVAGAALLVVLGGDTQWSITEEDSWIKYPTALALAVTSAIFLYGAARVRELATRVVYAVLACGSLFAALDELFMIHERIAVGAAGDVVTIVYGIVGVVVLAVLWRMMRRVVRQLHWQRGLWLLAFGMLLFVTATMFDTFDFAALAVVRRAAAQWLASGFDFGNAWYMVWAPKFFLNAWEEVFEFFAAVCFAYGAWVIVAGEFRARVASVHHAYPRVAVSVTSALAAACLMLFVATLATQPSGLLTDRVFATTRIADERDGLFHSDDLDFHVAHGVALANESAPWQRGTPLASGVFLGSAEKFVRVPDSDGLIRDADALALTTSTLYVSDSSQGRIFARDFKSGEWRTLPVAPDFPKHPEGLAVSAGGVVTVVDESAKSITQIFPDGRTVAEKPLHEKFQAPEGIALHAQLKKFVVTDDVTGTLFLYEPSKPLAVCADARAGLRAPEDVAVTPSGNIVVTDNGSRTIFVFNSTCKKIRALRVNPLFRDLQGVAAASDTEIYVVTANGFDNMSFMPSMVWNVKL